MSDDNSWSSPLADLIDDPATASEAAPADDGGYGGGSVDPLDAASTDAAPSDEPAPAADDGSDFIAQVYTDDATIHQDWATWDEQQAAASAQGGDLDLAATYQASADSEQQTTDGYVNWAAQEESSS